jgi:hypothetical protein
VLPWSRRRFRRVTKPLEEGPVRGAVADSYMMADAEVGREAARSGGMASTVPANLSATEIPQPGEVVIEHGDALTLINGFPTFDFLVTDPPYTFGAQGTDEWAISATVATVLREAAHRLRRGGWAVVFAASSWRSTAYMIEAVRGVLEPVRFGTWAKPAARSKVRTPGWAWASVNVIVMRKPGGEVCGEPMPDLDYIVEAPVKNGRRAELPPSVAWWAVSPFAQTCGLALDPFAGSGALLNAAARCRMRAVGFERDGSAMERRA